MCNKLRSNLLGYTVLKCFHPKAHVMPKEERDKEKKQTIPMIEQGKRPENFSHSKQHWQQWHPGKPKQCYSFCRGCMSHPYIDGQGISFLYFFNIYFELVKAHSIAREYQKILENGTAIKININYAPNKSQLPRWIIYIYFTLFGLNSFQYW